MHYPIIAKFSIKSIPFFKKFAYFFEYFSELVVKTGRQTPYVGADSGSAEIPKPVAGMGGGYGFCIRSEKSADAGSRDGLVKNEILHKSNSLRHYFTERKREKFVESP